MLEKYMKNNLNVIFFYYYIIIVHNIIGDIMRYIKEFMFFSISGFIFETLIGFITNNQFDSGILKGPYTPIYGIGILLIIYGSNYIFKHLHLKRYQETIIVMGLLFFTITILELIGGILIECIFDKVFWSYKSLKFNYGHYISLETSIIWTILGIIIYYLKDKLFKFIHKIPNIIVYIFLIVFSLDIIYTISKI